jgi:hypothetical protein
MTRDAASTRRSFLKGGALFAAPLVAATPAAVLADDGLRARLAKLEDAAAIRAIHGTWLRQFNAGESAAAEPLIARPKGAAIDQVVRRIAADHAGEPDAIEIAADGQRATGLFRCSVETQTAIAQDSTLAQMAHAQGGGFVQRTERRLLKVGYMKTGGAWAISKVELAPA